MSENKIYVIYKDNNRNFKELIKDNNNEEEFRNIINDGFVGKKIKNIWNSNYTMTWDKNTSTIEKADFCFYAGLIPFVNEKTYRLLNDVIPLNYIEFLPVTIENKETMYALNIVNINTEIFNEKKSTIKYFPDGDIYEIKKYIFNDIENIPVIFKIPQMLKDIFVSDEFVKIVKDNNLTGIDFKECKISRSLFNFKF